MKTPRLAQLLDADPGLQSLAAKARELTALSRLCAAALPPELASQIRALNVRDGRITIHAANASAAAKLKMLSARLGESLKNGPAEVNSVSVRVQPTAPRETDAAAHQKAPLSAPTLHVLSALRERLGSSPAGAALEKLLTHQGITSSKEPPAGAPGRKAGGRRPPQAGRT